MGDAYRHLQAGGGPAMSAYEKVTAKDPKNSLAFSRIGSLWYAAKNYELALENYEKAKQADPSNPLPYRDLANAYYWINKFERAKENIEKYRELSDKSPAVEEQYLNILYLQKDYINSIQKVRELMQNGAVKPGVHGILGESLLATGDTVNALKEYGIYIHTADKKRITPKDYVKFGDLFLVNKVADSANYYFNVGVTADTSQDKTETYRTIAESFRKAQIWDKSAEWYGKLVNTYPTQAKAIDHFYYGYILFVNKELDKANAAFKVMTEKFPDEPSGLYWSGRVLAATDEEAKSGAAVEAYNKYLEKVGPNYDKKKDLMIAYQYLALYYYNKSDKTNMKKYMDLIEGIEPTNGFLNQLKDLEKKMK